ncbi:MAG: transglycosylase domain-containing protein [Hyphomicrobiaceae bacterium]
MLAILRSTTRLIEALIAVPLWLLRTITIGLAFNPRLGPLRYVISAVLIYVLLAVGLVYAVAPVRGLVGAAYQSEQLRYAAERWLATAIYDAQGNFAGTFDPRLDSQRDVNFTGVPIAVGNYTANPDHKSIPVQQVPDLYWQCLKYHEDRNLGGWLNPFGIDLIGVLKIPYSTVVRSIQSRRLVFGVGGSTLPMQFARVIYKTPPRLDENPWEKIGRKLSEWWTAPVIYFELTRGGDDTPLKQWAANHLWLAQRTGGAPLHGVEVTSRIVFGKEAKDLSLAEQLVLASAVNKPIILLEGSDRLNTVRLDRWQYIVEVRARICAETLIAEPQVQKKVLFELVQLAGGPPDPKVRPGLQAALEKYAPDLAERASANPRIRANVLLPAARLGAREEMKQAFGFNWRNSVRGLTTTIRPEENLALRARLTVALGELQQRWKNRLAPGYTLDPAASSDGDRLMPHVIVVAADAHGRIVRYYENSQLAPYFGSAIARDMTSGRYIRASEPRQIASVGKMIAAITIANEVTDTAQTPYLDDQAPPVGLETCRRNGNLRRGRQAVVAFACSLNRPLEWRTARLKPQKIARVIDQLGFNMPPAPDRESATPPSTAAVRGLISGSPRRVHHMASVILASLTGRRNQLIGPPTLVRSYDFTSPQHAIKFEESRGDTVRPRDIIRRPSHAALRTFLQAPLCYQSNGRSHGTLKDLKAWCAASRQGLRLHFAKTGTAVTQDRDATIDTWIAGGLQFKNGAQYSYVVVVGTGSASEPFGRRLHSSQLAVPLLGALLSDLEAHAKQNPIVAQARKVRRRVAANKRRKKTFSIRDLIERNFFNAN